MTDEELESLGRSVEMRNHLTPREGSALVGEVRRLRAELAGRRAGEDWLALIRATSEEFKPGVCRDKVIDDMLAHIDYQTGVIVDLLNMDGRALREAGAAEERVRLVQVIRDEADQRGDNWAGAPLLRSVAGQLEEHSPPLPELLPPQEARLALDAERRKVAIIRSALDVIRERRTVEAIHRIAEEALKRIEEMEASDA